MNLSKGELLFEIPNHEHRYSSSVWIMVFVNSPAYVDMQEAETQWFGLVILTSRFEATRGLFWDGPRNFEPQSDDEDDITAGTPSPISEQQVPYTEDLQWTSRRNRVSNLEPSGLKAETSPLGHRGHQKCTYIDGESE
ncbi:hypothetical protein AVEN_195136-1 [Araneus ventricosus]|uniref:Uncharacterized protein n=1 Tax=Araneus ventricosus TaxID=182803 RepID=A0A4Y2BG64_ARAVE|nr:hypothetical protein AVEN_195136-1 [Araneus ventricosus]